MGAGAAGASGGDLAQHTRTHQRAVIDCAPLSARRAARAEKLDRDPFGKQSQDGTRSNLPWDVVTTVEIPGTSIRIQGHIDRLDLAGDGRRARVIDYKTGRLRTDMAQVVLDGGKELQRCLYAFAVRTLIGARVKVEASLLYPRAQEGEQALFPLPDVDAALVQLATALAIARTNMINGIVAPGADAGD